MLKVSDAFNSAFAAPDRELRARVTIGKTVYDSDDLTSINYDSGAMTGEQFSIGSTYMNSTKITFSHLVEGLKQLDEVLLEFGIVKADGTTEYVKMGTFIIDDKIQMDRNNNSTTIECMDRMVMLGGAYKSKLSYPATIKSVAVEIANMAGVRVNDTSFARLPNQSINEPIGYSYRDAIGIIAQFAMGFALFDRDGYLDIRTLVDSEFKIDPSQYFLKGLVKNETFFKLNGISCTVVTTSKDENGNETSKTTVLQSGSSSGSQIKLANNVMTQDVLDRMYESLKFTNYYPFILNWNGNPAVEAGDWLTLEDMQGNEFKVPNMSYTLTFNGGLTASSKAETSTNSSVTYSYGGSMSNIVNEIGGREGAEGNHIYEGTEDQKPLFPKEGDLWYKHVGPDTEEWIYKDGKWEFLTSTKPATDAQKAADAAQKEAEEAKNQANKAVNGANDAVAKAGFATDTATQAKSDAAAAGQSATTALTNAGTALTNAKNALDNVTKLDQTVKTEVTNINGQLAQKVSQTTFDTLKGTVTSQGTLINQNKDAIKLKADQTYVDTIKGTVENNTAAIDLNSKEIKLKAGQSDVDKLGGRVTDAEAQIKLQADQIKLTVSKTELTNVLGDYATQTWTQGQIKTTADSINLSVTKVDSKVDNLNTSDRNLLIKSGTFETGLASDVTVSNNTYGGNRILMIPKSPAANTAHDPYVPIPSVDMVGTEYVLSFYLKADVNGDKFAVNLFSPNTVTYAINSQGIVTNTPTGGDGYSWFTATNTWVRYWVKYTQTSTNAKKKLIIGRTGTMTIGKDNKGGFQLASPMLSEGNMTNKPWAAAPEDFATDTKFADLQITVNGIQGTVQNKADQSQVTQLAGQITSVVTSAANPNLIMNGGYPTTTEHWAGATDFAVTKHGFYRRGNLFVLGNIGTQEQNIGTDRVRVEAGAKYTISMIIFGSENVSSYDVWFLGRKNGSTANFDTSVLVAGAKKPIPNAAEYPNWTFTMPDVDEGYIRIDNNGTTNAPHKAGLYFTEVKLEKGAMATPYIQSAESSEIIQTKEMINLRVEKGDVVNQINISPESILIAGQKVHITGLTTIDRAVIKDAMIADVKADKITAGTLNAANVNVINLNANNITTGTIKGANLSMNLNTGEVLFQKGSIKSANGNLNLDISKGTMAVINEYKSGFYFEDGKLVLNDGWLEGTSSQPKYGSLEYNANYFTVNGLAVKGTEGVTIGTPGYNPSMEMMFSSVKESGIAIDRKHLEMGSVGPTVISSGNEFFMNLLTKQPFIAVGTTADGNFMTTDKPGSRISLYAEYVHIKSAYLKTASGSANVIVAADGALVRSTSASKYKTDIIRTNIPDYGEKLLNLPTATWTDIAETKRYRDDPTTQPEPTRNFGMIAEDLADAGLEMLVVRGLDGELEGINYDRIGPALIPVIAKLKNEVETLKRKSEEKTA